MRHPSITVVEPPQSRCRFALAWADITPPVGMYHRMWGAAKHERSTGVHRPLRATVAVFEALNGSRRREEADQNTSPREESASSRRRLPEQRQILLALDHCVMGSEEHGQLVARVAEAAGVAPGSILVVFSHTHAAGLMSLDRVKLPGGDLIPGYLALLAERSAALVKECLAKLEPAGIVYGTGRCDLAAHRDFYDEERKQFACGLNLSQAADDTVLVGRVTGAEGRLLASVVNYACHPTTLAWDNTLISPDYIGALREVVERATGAPCLFLQGASGELGPREGFVGDPTVADRNGRQLGHAALSALTALPEAGTKFCYVGPVVSGATLGEWAHLGLSANWLASGACWHLARWREPLKYRPGQPTPQEIAADLKRFEAEEDAAKKSGDEQRAADCRAMAERKRRLQLRLAQLPRGESFPLQVVLWRMGDAFWLGVQGESYSLLQRELRFRFPDCAIVVASIAADWGAAYLPPREIYGTGIYQETIAVVAPGSLEQLIESVAKRMAEVAP